MEKTKKMKFKETLKLIRQDPMNMWYYWQGTIRYWLYKNMPILLREHIKAQFEERLMLASECVLNGSCTFCGCKTPDLMMANKACGRSKLTKENQEKLNMKPCYNKMLNKKEYESLRRKDFN